MNYHFYADDSSLYLIFHLYDIEAAVSRVEGCVAWVYEWMKLKSLKLNPSKTELLLITSKPIYKKLVCATISICDTLIEPSEAVKMIVGILLDKHITVEQHVTSVCRAAHYHLQSGSLLYVVMLLAGSHIGYELPSVTNDITSN